jgi:hypothetical protein
MRESARWSGSVGVGVGVGVGEGDGVEAVVAPPQPASHIARANVKRGKKAVAGIFARRIITLERSISPHLNLQLEPIFGGERRNKYTHGIRLRQGSFQSCN